MSRIPLLFSVLALLLLAACSSDENVPITVAVFTAGERCEIKGRKMACTDAARYLREELKVSPNRQIDISMSQIDKNDADVDRVAKMIRSSGFTDVRAWHFGFK